MDRLTTDLVKELQLVSIRMQDLQAVETHFCQIEHMKELADALQKVTDLMAVSLVAERVVMYAQD